jgi:hypothetical protein
MKKLRRRDRRDRNEQQDKPDHRRNHSIATEAIDRSRYGIISGIQKNLSTVRYLRF